MKHGRDWMNQGFLMEVTIIPRVVGSTSLQAGAAAMTTVKLKKMSHSEERRQRKRN